MSRAAVALAVAACLLPPFSARAQEEPSLSVTAQVDKTEVRQNEKLIFSITIAGTRKTTPKVELASLTGFKILATGQNQRIQIREGQAQQALMLSYTLAPTTAGTHTLGAVKVEYEGKVYETQPIEIQVLEADKAPESEPESELEIPEGGLIL